MAWTAPMTFVANSPLTAAQLNMHLRDNLLETAPAKASEAGAYLAVDGENRIVERRPARFATSESGTTTSTSYTDLDGASVGPAVTVQSSEFALVAWGVECWNSGTGTSRCTIDVTGDTNIPGTDGRAITTQGGAGNRTQMSHVVYYADLTPGTNSFEMKYRVSSGTGTFALRRILVMPY